MVLSVIKIFAWDKTVAPGNAAAKAPMVRPSDDTWMKRNRTWKMRTDRIKPMCLQKNLPRATFCTPPLTAADLVSNRVFAVRIQWPTTWAMTRPYFGHPFSNAQTSGHEKKSGCIFQIPSIFLSKKTYCYLVFATSVLATAQFPIIRVIIQTFFMHGRNTWCSLK